MPIIERQRPDHSVEPVRVIAGFAALIVIGAILLAMPFATVQSQLSAVDALFTATSAVCVTGLSTISIGDRLSGAGQVVLLALIQLGGLGITTVSTILLAAAGRATLGHAVMAGESLAAVRVKPGRLLVWVALITLSAEALGAIVLASRSSWENGWWTAIFHSISAFCNAGFSLSPESLGAYRADPIALGTISALVVLGGLGFIVLRQLTLWTSAKLARRRLPLFFHSRVVLFANVVLWTLGATILFLLERNNTLDGMSPVQSIGEVAFQSISARTAGFNTIDVAALREPTLFALMFFMLIGASPGGCGGGLKVTTATVILATMIARLKGADAVALLRRTVPPTTVRRSFLLLSLTLLFLTLIVGGLLFTEESRISGPRNHRLTVLAFEAVSAFGTVGFTAGVTPTLSTPGKVIIMGCMFVGRLGPLLVALAILRPRTGPAYSYPEEELAIG